MSCSRLLARGGDDRYRAEQPLMSTSHLLPIRNAPPPPLAASKASPSPASCLAPLLVTSMRSSTTRGITFRSPRRSTLSLLPLADSGGEVFRPVPFRAARAERPYGLIKAPPPSPLSPSQLLVVPLCPHRRERALSLVDRGHRARESDRPGRRSRRVAMEPEEEARGRRGRDEEEEKEEEEEDRPGPKG